MKVFWVLGWYVYYPSVDNFVASFETLEEANTFLLEAETLEDGYDRYRVIDISDRL